MTIGRRVFDYDPVSGMTTWFEYDQITKTSILKYEQDCEDALYITQAMANDTEYTKRGIKKDWWLYAHLPDSICVKLLTEHGINVWSGDPEHIARAFKFVNDRDWMKLKTTSGYHQPKP